VARSNKRKPVSEINVVPYIDVMLVLLIIFMITTPIIQQGVEIDLPQGDANSVETEDIPPLVVTVDANGRYFLDISDNASQAIDTENMQLHVAAVLRNKPQTPVMIRGDKNVAYGTVINAMVALQAAGVPSIGLMTDPAE